MHQAVRDFHRSCLAQAGHQPLRVVEIGSKDLNGTIRDLFSVGIRFAPADPDNYYLGVDLAPGSMVDWVGDFVSLTLEDGAKAFNLTDTLNPPDWVASAEALEHYEFWSLVIYKAFNLLSPGGYLCLTCAGPGRMPHSGLAAEAIHPGEYYGNVDPGALLGVLTMAGFEVLICHSLGADTQAFARKPP